MFGLQSYVFASPTNMKQRSLRNSHILFMLSRSVGFVGAKERQKYGDQIHINTVECMAQHALLMSCVENKEKHEPKKKT